MREVIALLVNNLYGLGIGNDSGAASVSTRTFTALENHRRSFEYIAFGLLGSLDARLCRERLMPSYPCHDALKAKEFRNCVYRWLIELKRCGTLDNRALVRRSLLDDCAGERYEDLLFYLSSHVYRSAVDDILTPEPLLSRSPDLRTKVTDLELIVQFSIGSYRLRKLQLLRQRSKAEFKTLSRRLQLLSTSQSYSSSDFIDESIGLKLSENQRFVIAQLKRIEEAVSTRYWLPIFNNADTYSEDIQQILPWRKYSASSSPVRWDRTGINSRHVASRERRQRRLAQVLENAHDANINNDSNTTKPILSTALPPPPLRRVYKLFHQYGEATILAHESELSHLRSLCPSKVELSLKNRNDIGEVNAPAPVVQVKAGSTTPRAQHRKPNGSSVIAIPALKRREGDLLKTALKHNAFLFNDTAVVAEMPQTPQRSTSKDLPSSVKSIGRLIDILNEPISARSVSSSPSRAPLTQRYGRSNVESFSLWDYTD